MIMLMYFGCDSDTIKVVKIYAKTHLSSKHFFPGQQAYDDQTNPDLADICHIYRGSQTCDWLPVSDTNPELATCCQFVICKSRTTN